MNVNELYLFWAIIFSQTKAKVFMANSIGVIFDMDGVIVDSNPIHKKAIQVFCKEHNLDLTDEYLENELYGRTNEEWIPALFGEMSKTEVKKLADEKEQLFRDIFAPEDHIVEGIPNFLEQLKNEQIPMAVATSAPSENAEYILSRLDIKHYFKEILNSSHVTKGKPDPEVYLKTAAALDKAPESCIVFEDSVSGVQAGLQAGTSVIGVTTTHSREELDSCHFVIDDFQTLSLDDLWKIINQTEPF